MSTFDLLKQLAADSAAKNNPSDSKQAVEQEPDVVELHGVLPPEIAEAAERKGLHPQFSTEGLDPDLLERARNRAEENDDDDEEPISLSEDDDDDDWDDDEEDYTPATNWREMSFDDLSFSTRIVNAMGRSGVPNLAYLEGWSKSEVLNIRGISRTSLQEIMDFTAEKGYPDFITARKSRKSAEAGVEEAGVEEAVVEEAVVEEAVVEEAASEPSPGDNAIFASSPSVTQDGYVPEPVVSASPKMLAIGSCTVSGVNLVVSSFEEMYRNEIQGVCKAANVKSLSLVEYGKGWGALAAAVRDKGWPKGVDVIATRHNTRYEILAVLAELADIVIEG